MNIDIYNKLIKEMNKATKQNEVPVAALITYNNKIIATAHNKREKLNDVMGHAEILCIKKASKKLKTWKLDQCTLYVTLKPCSMCNTIIKESRINKSIYILDKLPEKKEYEKTIFEKNNDIQIENNIKEKMNEFFKNKR